MKDFKTITKKESYQLCAACLAIETGSYLLRNSNDERVLIHEIIEAENTKNPTERQKEILEWKTVCTDYLYAKEHGYIGESDSLVKIKWKDEKAVK